MLDNPVHMG